MLSWRMKRDSWSRFCKLISPQWSESLKFHTFGRIVQSKGFTQWPHIKQDGHLSVCDVPKPFRWVTASSLHLVFLAAKLLINFLNQRVSKSFSPSEVDKNKHWRSWSCAHNIFQFPCTAAETASVSWIGSEWTSFSFFLFLHQSLDLVVVTTV